jgi:cob(I)alamin adenosyltransferase
MVKTERRIKAFSSGLKKLDKNSLNYIHRLAQVLFLVERPPVNPSSGEKSHVVRKGKAEITTRYYVY